MTVEFVPLLPVHRDLYALPRGLERCRARRAHAPSRSVAARVSR